MLTSLQSAVVAQLGYKPEDWEAVPEGGTSDAFDEISQTLSDVARHGADGGFGGFTYFADTVAFYEANRADIKRLARDEDRECEALGLPAFVAGFRCVNLKAHEVDEALDEGEGDAYVEVANALAWFALETVARQLFDE